MPVTVLERIVNLSPHTITLKNQEQPLDDCTVPGSAIRTLARGPWIPWATSGKRIEIRVGDTAYYLWQDHGADGDHVRFSKHDAWEGPEEKNQLPGFSRVRNERDPITLIVGPEKTIRGSIKPFESWMADLGSKLAGRKLNEILLPGTHDSGTYSIPPTGSDLSPDNGQLYKWRVLLKLLQINIVGPIAKSIIAGWARVQDRNITEQLEGGVRYFDLRLCGSGDDFYIVHGMWGAKIDKILDSVEAFIASHPKEIVLLDVNHFYDADDARCCALAARISSRFGHRLVPRDVKASAQLSTLWNSQQQVLVLFDNAAAVNAYATIWPSAASFVAGQPWNDDRVISDVKAISTFLDEELKELEKNRPGNPDRFTRIGATFTTNNMTTLGYGHLYKVTETTAPEVMKWLLAHGSSSALNIVNTDFFELASQVDTIVSQNLR
jgi:hypothetical protein